MKFRLLAAVLFMAALSPAPAVILFRTADPEANTTAPGGDLAGSGWQYEGLWGGFLGTPIAPQYFISAKHIGLQGDLVFQGATYHVVAAFPDPASDLQILKVAEIFPSFAPLYSRQDEVGQRLAEFGRGTQRGPEIFLGGTLRGWAWGAGDGRMRWGENLVSAIFSENAENDYLVSAFDQNGLPNECHLSAGDSGGAAFINDAGIWKLAGINYAVDGPLYTDSAGNGAFTAALFDARGFFAEENGNYVEITGPTAVPTSFYPTRISRRLPWIASVLAEGLLTREADRIAFTYTRLLLPPTDLSYALEQSNDLRNWSPAALTEEVLWSNASVERVRASRPLADAGPLFFRLRLSAP